MMKLQPAASAGAALRVIMALGKFQGVIAPTTPKGCFTVNANIFGKSLGEVSPERRRASPAMKSRILTPRCTSTSDSL